MSGYRVSLLSDEQKAELVEISSTREKAVRRQLTANRNKVFAIRAIQSLQRDMDAFVESDKRRGVSFACKPGCSHCCTGERVEVVAPEVFLIARHLREAKADLGSLLPLLEEHSRKAQGARMGDYGLTCPLLKDGRCSIYQVRPTMCRKYNSLDAAACASKGEQVPESQDLVLKGGAAVNGTLEGYKRAQHPLYFSELGQALLVALTDATAEDRWYKGEEVFEKIPEMVDSAS